MMAGGDAAVFERVKPLLDDLTVKATLMGPVGAGQGRTKAPPRPLHLKVGERTDLTGGLVLGIARVRA